MSCTRALRLLGGPAEAPAQPHHSSKCQALDKNFLSNHITHIPSFQERKLRPREAEPEEWVLAGTQPPLPPPTPRPRSPSPGCNNGGHPAPRQGREVGG